MNLLYLPWLEIALALCLVGALAVSRLRDPYQAARWGMAFTGSVFASTFLAWLAFYLGVPESATTPYSLEKWLWGRRFLEVDVLSAPLVPMVALLHFLTGLATTRTKMRRFSFSWSLASEGMRLLAFCSTHPWVVITGLAASAVPPYIELVNRGKPTRVYVLHMTVFVALLVLGWTFVELDDQRSTLSALSIVLLLAAILVRCGTIPAHCWVTDWFEHASFGNALLFITPLSGVYAAVRLVMPIAPEWALQSIGLFSLATAVYCAGMATIQLKARRLFAYLFLSHASLVLVGLELVGLEHGSSVSLTGALSLWFSVALSLQGFGLTLRALEARFGPLSLTRYHGLYESSPALAVCFLLTGLASVGFPGTLGFVSADLLVDGAVEASLTIGIAVIAVAALNGIAVLRAYFLLFTGARHASTVALGIGLRERIAVLTLSALILGGGLFPQPGITSRHQAAEEILKERRAKLAQLRHPE
jgi:NADH-quinone oxidoreductase subunit M